MIKNVVKILELLGDRLEVCVSVHTVSPEPSLLAHIGTKMTAQAKSHMTNSLHAG